MRKTLAERKAAERARADRLIRKRWSAELSKAVEVNGEAQATALAGVDPRTFRDWRSCKRFPPAPEFAHACEQLGISSRAVLHDDAPALPLLDLLERHFESVINRQQPGIPFAIAVDGVKALKLVEARAREIVDEFARTLAVAHDVRTNVQGMHVDLLTAKIPTATRAKLVKAFQRRAVEVELSLGFSEQEAIVRAGKLLKGFVANDSSLVASTSPIAREARRQARAVRADVTPT